MWSSGCGRCPAGTVVRRVRARHGGPPRFRHPVPQARMAIGVVRGAMPARVGFSSIFTVAERRAGKSGVQ